MYGSEKVNGNTICLIECFEELLYSILLFQERLVLVSIFTVFTIELKHLRSIPNLVCFLFR